MVECHLAKVEVAGPNPVSRSKKACRYGTLFVFAKSAAIKHTIFVATPRERLYAEPSKDKRTQTSISHNLSLGCGFATKIGRRGLQIAIHDFETKRAGMVRFLFLQKA